MEETMPGWSTLVDDAAGYARAVHRNDRRKGSGESYFDGHLEPVAELVRGAGGDDVQVAAAYLHDAAEDHGGEARLDDIRDRFGDQVATIVGDLSDSLVDTRRGVEKEEWHLRKQRYLATLEDKPARSLEVAAADKLHNAQSVLSDFEALGDELWTRFTTGSGADQRWYYEQLADVLSRRLPDHPTVRRLVETVAELGRRMDAHPG